MWAEDHRFLRVLLVASMLAVASGPVVSQERTGPVCTALSESEGSRAAETEDSASSSGKRLRPITVRSLDFEVEVRDGNPLFLPGNEDAWADGDGIYPALSGPTSLEQLSYDDVPKLAEERVGAAADGVSRLVLVLDATGAGRFEAAIESGGSEDGSIELLGSGETCPVGESHLMVAVYTPPVDFGEGSGQRVPEQMLGGVEARTVELGFTFVPEGGAHAIHRTRRLQLVRPPVVLVHGFGDEPINAWMTAPSVASSLNSYLRNKGLLTFLVDYQASNGRDYTGTSRSSFRDNRYVVWTGHSTSNLLALEGFVPDDSPQTIEANDQEAFRGGIRQALTHYRRDLGIAATRADVVGHSMGGILPRVYAAEELPDGVPPPTLQDTSDDVDPVTAYNPRYRRPDNFEAGDINRLVTLDSPHHGSAQPEHFEQLTRDRHEEEEWADSLYRTALDGVAFVARVRAESKAMQGLKIESRALQLIGETKVKSHVIAGVTRPGGQEDLYYDPSRSYLKVLEAVGALFYWFPHHLDTLLDRVGQDFQDTSWEADYLQARRNLEDVVDAEWQYWTGVRKAGSGFLRLASGSLLESGEHGTTVAVPYVVLEALRTFMFGFDRNDSTVRLDSQLAGLDFDADRRFLTYVALAEPSGPTPDIRLNVLHSQAPRYLEIQRRIVELLKSDPSEPSHFRDSLPPAGQRMALHRPAMEGGNWRLTGEHAMGWSGLVFDHAQAYLDVAREREVVIMTRPVNPDSTPLIRGGAATKGMNVKGKSASWGPQKGYIPADQTYSKLWFATKDRKDEIEKYARKTLEMLEGNKPEYRITRDQIDSYPMPGDADKFGEPIAVRRPLEHRIGEHRYTVWARPGTDPRTGTLADWAEHGNAEDWIYLCREDAGRTASACDCPEWFDWRTRGTDFDPSVQPTPTRESPSSFCSRLEPLEVLADNAHPEVRYLTADYDLLTFGFFCPTDGSAPHQEACRGTVSVPDDAEDSDGTCLEAQVLVDAFDGRLWAPPDPLPCYDTQKGLITEAQKDVLDELNDAVEATGYTGGKVSHHGPETQFFESPYVDYPIIVFDPGVPDENLDLVGGTAEILAIPQGPPGFRDLHLKRYFLRKIRQGFWLYPNPYGTANWHWAEWPLRGGEFQGWREEDDARVLEGKATPEMARPPCVLNEVRRRERERREIHRATREGEEPREIECVPADGCRCTEAGGAS